MTKTKAILLIFFLAIIIYSNSLAGEFVWDDELFVVKNTPIRTLTNYVSFFTDPKTGAAGQLWNDVYRPLATLSYALDYAFWRLNAFGYHLTNMLLHSLNGILLFLLLYLLFENYFLALFAGLLFISHPIQTEAVSWISGRSSVLFLFFYLASLIYYVKYSNARKKFYLIFSIASFALSLFSKEMAVTLPLVLILYDAYFKKDSLPKKRFLIYLPYFILAVLYISVRSFLLGRISQMGWWGGSPYHTFLTMLKVVADYIKLLFAPVNLSAVFYPVPISTSIAETKVVIAIISLALVFAISFLLHRQNKTSAFAIWWFFITLAPVLNMVPIKALEAERFLYLPSIGFCLFLAIVIEKFDKKVWRSREGRGLIAISTAALLVAAYSMRTMARNEDWKDTITISKKTISADPLNPWALVSLGAYLAERGDYEGALKPLRKAAFLAKDFYLVHYTLGTCYLKMARYLEAVKELGEVIKLKPDSVEAKNALGVSYANLKRLEEAAMEFEGAMRMDPSNVNSYLNMGRLYEMRGENEKALAEYHKIELNTKERRDIAISYIRTGDLYLKMGLKDEAKLYYEKAVDSCDRGLDGLRGLAMGKLEQLE